jgi:hypothetical protein
LLVGLAGASRKLTLFTAANPGMSDGGFIGPQKSEVYAALAKVKSGIVPWCIIPASYNMTERMTRIARFMAKHKLGYPLVCKPDLGERGEGVTIIRSAQELAEHMSRVQVTTVAQAYIPGREFGVFYIRRPNEPTGKIVDLAEKCLLSVTGTGTHTLEQLILSHDRAVCMANLFLRRHSQKLRNIPAPGEIVMLGEVAAHCRGAVFYNANYLRTELLETAIEQICQAYTGFYFGRFDIRVPSTEDLQAGRNLHIIELNGVTSEPISLYDPNTSLWKAWHMLCRQWYLAWTIGKENYHRGASTVPFRTLCTRTIAHFRARKLQRRAFAKPYSR